MGCGVTRCFPKIRRSHGSEHLSGLAQRLKWASRRRGVTASRHFSLMAMVGKRDEIVTQPRTCSSTSTHTTTATITRTSVARREIQIRGAVAEGSAQPPPRPGMWMRLTLPLLTIPRSPPAFDPDGRRLFLRIPYERRQLSGPLT